VPPLFVVEGFFSFGPGGSLQVSPEGESSSFPLTELLRPYVGVQVEFQFHFWPPSPLNLSSPDMGTCAAPGACPIHREDPSRLISYRREGVLGEGSDSIGGEPLPWGEWSGHRARLIVFTDLYDQGNGWEHLSAQAGALGALLGLIEKQGLVPLETT
jgi:hypothetical protein